MVAVEQLLGIDCDEAAEEHRVSMIATREEQAAHVPPNGGKDLASYYEQLEASIMHG